MIGKDLLSLLGIILVLLLVMAGCYLFTRWAGTGLGGPFVAGGSGTRMKVVERLPLGRDQVLLVVRLGERYLLLGSSPAGISLLTELTGEEGALWASAAEPTEKPGMDFRELVRKLREKK